MKSRGILPEKRNNYLLYTLGNGLDPRLTFSVPNLILTGQGPGIFLVFSIHPLLKIKRS